ncbi:MAG: peptide deformylase [Eubacteriales bacterium]
MAQRNIQKGEDNPRLRKKSKTVKEIDDRIKELVEDMKETLAAEEGVGLAAPQVGVLKRVIIVDDGSGVFEVINPEISNPQGSQIGIEGCLSLLPKSGYVERPKTLTVTGKNLKGEALKIDAEDFLARIICHEVDHLEGVLFTDKVIPEDELEEIPEDEDAREI